MVNDTQSSLKNMSIICENGTDLPVSPAALCQKFDDYGIFYKLHHHKPVFTVEESREVDGQIEGQHTRNMFLKDKKGKMFLLTLRVDFPIDIKKLEAVIGASRLSFGSEARLWDYLGVRSGSVTPFAIINDSEKLVTPIWDQGMMAADILNCHPLLNNMTVSMKPEGWHEFMHQIGRVDDLRVLNLDEARPD